MLEAIAQIEGSKLETILRIVASLPSNDVNRDTELVKSIVFCLNLTCLHLQEVFEEKKQIDFPEILIRTRRPGCRSCTNRSGPLSRSPDQTPISWWISRHFTVSVGIFSTAHSGVACERTYNFCCGWPNAINMHFDRPMSQYSDWKPLGWAGSTLGT